MTADLQKKMAANEAKNQAASDVSDSESEEHVHGEDCSHEEGGQFSHITNRNEKKAREVLSKLGWKAVPGIERVTLKRAKNVYCH